MPTLPEQMGPKGAGPSPKASAECLTTGVWVLENPLQEGRAAHDPGGQWGQAWQEAWKGRVSATASHTLSPNSGHIKVFRGERGLGLGFEWRRGGGAGRM